MWTSATPYNYADADPDVIIRQAWIQGSYMEALSLDVLKEGLRIQEALLGPEVTCDGVPDADHYRHGFQNHMMEDEEMSSFGTSGVFFHSPLLYFNCSAEALDRAAGKIGETVNGNIERRSAADVRLRWGTVFAGKHISHHQLLAADALVISLFHSPNSTIGALWDKRAAKLVQEAKEHQRFKVYPRTGVEGGNTLYEVRRPAHPC